MSLETTVSLSIIAKLLGANDLGTPQWPGRESFSKKFLTGIGVDQSDMVFADERTLAASASETLDFNGALLDPLGGPFTPSKLRGLYVEADPANTNDVVIGNATNPILVFGVATGKVAIRPGGCFLFVDPTGVTVTAATADEIKALNSAGGTGVTYRMLAWGTSA
jgi:hypothetical protein